MERKKPQVQFSIVKTVGAPGNSLGPGDLIWCKRQPEGEGRGLADRLVHVSHCFDYTDRGTGLRPEGMGPTMIRGPGGRGKVA